MYENNMINERNKKVAGGIIDNLKKRNMSGYYADNREEALKLALSLIPEGSVVTQGGSVSTAEIGLKDALINGNYDFIDRDNYENKDEAARAAYTADVYLGSCNAVSEEGVLVNIDGNSNRISAYAYGPKKLVLIVGMNKVAKDTDAALKRARNTAAPVNAQRFNLNTPCAKTGSCMNCMSPDTICCQFLITRFSRHKDRIHVILVNEDLGY